jgi:hypothetical protein
MFTPSRLPFWMVCSNSRPTSPASTPNGSSTHGGNGGAPGSFSVSVTSNTNRTGPIGCRITRGRAPALICRRNSRSHRCAVATNRAPGICMCTNMALNGEYDRNLPMNSISSRYDLLELYWWATVKSSSSPLRAESRSHFCAGDGSGAGEGSNRGSVIWSVQDILPCSRLMSASRDNWFPFAISGAIRQL